MRSTALTLKIIMSSNLVDMLQAAFGSLAGGGDVTAQLMNALATTIQTQAASATAMQQQIQILEARVSGSSSSRSPM